MSDTQTEAQFLASLQANIAARLTAIGTPSPAPTPTPMPAGMSVTSIMPLIGPAGTAFTITGTGFGDMPGVVYFSIFGAPIVSWSDTKIVATVPESFTSGSAQINVHNAAGAQDPFPVDFVITGGATPTPTPTPSPTPTPTPVPVPTPTPTPVPTGTLYTLAVTAPFSTVANGIMFVVNGDAPPYQLYGDAVSDTEMVLTAATHPFAASAPGMKNLEVWMHNASVARFTPDAAGNVSGSLDLSGQHNGPLVIDVYAWNSTPGNAYDFEAKQRFHVYVTGGADYLPPMPAGAAGMSQVWEDDFTGPLSLSSTDVTAKWYPDQPGHVGNADFGEAVYIDPDNIPAGGINPFMQRDTFLRIRCQSTPGVVDPQPWGRKFSSGLLSTGRPSGTTGTYFDPPFYAECRMMCAIGINPWPAFWMVTRQGLLDGTPNSIEIDAVESYGNQPAKPYHLGAQVHPSGPIIPTSSFSPYGDAKDPLFWEFHTFGVKVDATNITWFVDNIQVGQTATTTLATGPSPYFLMVDNSIGGGWPTDAPPSGYYDLWVDFVRVWK